MPPSRQPKNKYSITAEEKQQLVLVINEMRARGIPLPPDLVDRAGMLPKAWNMDSAGYFVRNDGKHFSPKNEAQVNFIASTSRFAAYVGSRGSGKTCGGAQKAMQKVRQGESGVVINPDMENFKLSTWPELRLWIDWNMVVPSQKYRKNSEWEPHQPFVMVFTNGAKMYCKGLKDPDSARGPNINWLWYDEAGRDKTGLGWKLANAGVRVGKLPQAWITTTPKGMVHWIYKFFVRQEYDPEALRVFQELSPGQPFAEIFYATIEDNKHNLDPAFYASMLATYPTGWMRAQELEGKFVDEGGQIGDRQWFSGKVKPISPLLAVATPVKRVRYYDLAASEKKIAGIRKSDDPDFTVGAKVAAGEGLFVIEDMVAGQLLWHDIKRLIKDTALRDGLDVPIYVEQEPGSGGKNQVAELMGDPELAGFTIRPLPSKGDKVQRALPWFARAEQGLVYLVQGKWNATFLDELDGFTLYGHDDYIDAVSGCFMVLVPPTGWKNVEFKHL